VTVAVLYAFDVAQMREFWTWHVLYLSNFLIAMGGPFLVFWSLSVEEQFYLLLPFVIIFTPARRRLSVAASIILVGFASRILALWLGINWDSFEVSLAGKLEVLGAGVLLGVYSHRKGARNLSWFQGPVVWALGAVAATALALQLAIFYGTPANGVPRYLTFTLTTAMFFGWMVLCAARGFSGLLGVVAGHPAVRYVGRISYGIYIMHDFFPSLIWSPEVKGLIGDLSPPMVAITSLLLSLLVPSVSWYVLERPVLGLRRYFRGGRLGWSRSAFHQKRDLGVVLVEPNRITGGSN
jgi:peptidoglycan/LPS O-acetylase OafA/YrhL